jgi:predicted RND superfamily exporter protein
VAISAADVTAPRVLAWMTTVQRRVLALDSRLRPGPNLAELLVSGGGGTLPSPARTRQLLRVVPPYFTQAVVSSDRRRGELSFGVPLQPVDRQAQLLGRIDALLAKPPPGVRADPAGLIAVAATSVEELEAGRPRLTLIAFALVFVVLLAVRRRLEAALLPLIPALLAAGLSSLAILAFGVRLSPLAAGLEPLVLAVGVEFGVLLEARYREARRDGRSYLEAREIAVGTVGTAAAIAAAVVACGFAGLLASRLELLRELGGLMALELLATAALAILLVPALAAQLDARRGATGVRR